MNFVKHLAFVCFWLTSVAHAQEPVTIRLSTKGNDISFDQNAIQVPFKKEISLKFANEASKDSAILHNVAILKPGSTDAVIKEIQKLSYNIELIRNHKDVLAMTKALEPGQEEVLTFKPSKPGFYPFICLMPGHGDMLNMKGVLNVVKK